MVIILKNEILYELLKNKETILIDYIYKKYYAFINNFYNYVINKSFIKLKPLEINFAGFIPEFIESISKIQKDIFLKYGFLRLLKKLMIQKIIMINREQMTHKRSTLSMTYFGISDYICLDNETPRRMKNEPFWDFFKSECYKVIKNKIQLQIIDLIFKEYKPNEISNILNMDVKKIYNHIFYIKQTFFIPIYCKYFN